MDKKKLKKARAMIRALRNASANIRSQQLVRLATKLGRRLSDRGKHPTYISETFPDLRPISIPSHPGTMKLFTAENILDDLEMDCFRWEQELDDDLEVPNAEE